MKQLWSPQELEMYWSLTPEQVIFCRKSARSKNLLPFALQFKFLENEGRFPRQRNEFAMPVIRFVAEQLEVHRDTLRGYEFDSRSCERHRRTIRDWLRFRPSGAEDLAALKDYLLNEFPLSPLSRDELREDSLEWFRQRRIEPPTIEQLDRLIASSLSSQEKRLFEQVAASITEASKIELDRLLKGSTPLLAKLKADPGRPGMAVIKSEVESSRLLNLYRCLPLVCRSCPRKRCNPIARGLPANLQVRSASGSRTPAMPVWQSTAGCVAARSLMELWNYLSR